jgi:ABC-2 type transport system permease protein
VAALLLALLGGGAGVIVLISVFRPVPMTDPHRRSGNLLENGSDFTQVLFMLVLVAATAAPAYLGARYLPGPAAALVGLLSGVILGWLLGDIAARRLEATAPDLLAQLRGGANRRPAGSVDWSAVTSALEGSLAGSLPEVDLGERKLRIEGAAPARRAAVYLCLTLGWVPLVAQGIVPAWMKLADAINPSWFLALHLPGPLQWPTIAAMLLVGGLILGFGLQQLGRARRESAGSS